MIDSNDTVFKYNKKANMYSMIEADYLMENNIFPLSYITDKNNPVFKQTEEHFKKSGIKQKLLMIILPIVYTKENNT